MGRRGGSVSVLAMGIAETLVAAIGLYAALGLAFGVLFVGLGVGRMDAAARGTHIGFRLLILPGVIALWPFLLVRLIVSRSGGPA